MAETAGTLVCPACGAAVPRTGQVCGYCGAPIVHPAPAGMEGPAEQRTFCARCGTLYPSRTMRCPRCPPGNWDSRGGKCPRCAAELEPVTMGKVTVDRCPQCKGHWFDGDELEQVLDLTTEGVSSRAAGAMRQGVPPAQGPVEEVRYVACVRCGERMARRQIAHRAGIVIDICRFHGVWFDGGELERFAEFAKAGGLELVRHDGIVEAEHRRKMAEAAPSRTTPPIIEEHEGLVWGSMGLAALLRLLFRVLR